MSDVREVTTSVFSIKNNRIRIHFCLLFKTDKKDALGLHFFLCSLLVYMKIGSFVYYVVTVIDLAPVVIMNELFRN